MSKREQRDAYWRKIVSEFKASGLSQLQFTRKRRLSPGAFRYHLYKTGKPVSAPGFVRVQPSPTSRDSSPPVAAVVFGLVRVEFGTQPDAAYVAQLVHALGRAES